MDKKYKYLAVILLIVFSLIAFGRIMGNDFINFDDDQYITENNHIKSGINSESVKWAFTAVVCANWHPLTLLSHAIDWSMFKEHAGGHHFVSLLLHIGAVLLLFFFLNKTTKRLWPSAFVAALFALHPLRVESVAWAAERKDVLSMFFGLAAIYAYAYYAEKPQLSKYFLCLILFALSLMAKPMLVTLPFVLLLLDYWPLYRWQRALKPEIPPVMNNKALMKEKSGKRKASAKPETLSIKQSNKEYIGPILWEKIPLIVLAVLSSILTVWAQNRALASLQKFPFPERIANAIVSYVAYLGKFFWPVDLAVFYPYSHSFPIWQVFAAAVVLLIISFIAFYLRKKAPFLLVGWLWYIGTLIPVIGLVQVGAQAMADRYTYLPSIGIGIMLTWSIVYLLPKGKVGKIVLWSSAMIVIIILTALTWQQCGYWKNGVTIFSRALQVTENNYLAHDSLGVALDADGKHQEAFYHYKSSIKIKSDYANAYYNLAMTFKDRGNIEEAENNFREVLRINPHFRDANNNLGIILEMYHKKYDEAIYHYRQELKIQPDNFGTHYNLGIALAQKGEREEAIKHFQMAVYLNPEYAAARQWLQMMLDEEKNKTKR